MSAFPPNTLERDLTAIFGAPGKARDREGRAKRLAIALAVLATLSITAMHRMPGPERGMPIAAHPGSDQPASVFSASPVLPVPRPVEVTPFEAAPRVVVAERSRPIEKPAPSPKSTAIRRRPEPQTVIASLPTRERLTLAQSLPSKEEQENEGIISTAELGHVQVRAARLEAVDAIRTLRLR